MEMPDDVSRNFDRLYREVDLRLLQNDRGRMIPSAWIDRFRKVSDAMAYTNVQGLHYADFRDAFMRHYAVDFEWVSGQVTDIMGEHPTGEFDSSLLIKFAGI